jgi:predicted ATP-dependent serine protease
MKTLSRAVGRPDIGGEPMPTVFRTFDTNQIVLRRAEVSMIAGTPGAGKSTLALALALRMQAPTLYLSADTNAHTMAMRLYSMITGVSQSEAEKIISEDPINSRNNLALASHIYWSFDSAPSLSDIDDEVTAIEELLGEAPALIVIDNLMDISMDGGEEFSNMRSALKELKYLARDTNAAILVLHHTQEGYVGDPCQPRSSLQGKVAQLPALILTVGQSGNGLLGVAAVKNRYGRADQSGKSPVWLQFNPEYMFIADLEEAR